MEDAISFVQQKRTIIPVDEWVPGDGDLIFKHTKGAIILEINKLFNSDNKQLNIFVTSSKKCYDSSTTPKVMGMREHFCNYMNYFEKFYDDDHELVSVYARIKYLIDCERNYNDQAFIYDIKKYILCPSLIYKFRRMNEDNYIIDLESIKKKKAIEEDQKYDNEHGMILMEISLLMNAVIPLLTHYMYEKKITNKDCFLLSVYDVIIQMYNDRVDIVSKLYETANKNIIENSRYNERIWNKQDIRGINETILSQTTVENIIINLIPKYQYKQNMVCYNFKALLNTIKYQVTGIEYDQDYIPYDSGKRDFEQNSEFDKFEAYLSKLDESLYIQNKVSSEETMKMITSQYGPFDEKEIKYYISRLLCDDNYTIINTFQRDLLYNLFYKYFGDVQSVNGINKEDYVKLIMAGKKILESNSMIVLPYILSSKVVRLSSRKSLSAAEIAKIKHSEIYALLLQKYKSEVFMKHAEEIIATILSSEFSIIDFNNNEIDGLSLSNVPPEQIEQEVLQYIYII